MNKLIYQIRLALGDHLLELTIKAFPFGSSERGFLGKARHDIAIKSAEQRENERRIK